MWGDADWRSLSRDAQWLYELLLTHPDTNRAGVCDWRPGRLAVMAAHTTAAQIRKFAAELEERFFVVTDDTTEEILIRSFVKYDGVLKQPNMSVTMANDWAGVASARLRAVVAFEVQGMRLRRPEWPAWSNEKLRTLLESPGLNIKRDPSGDPSVDPSPDPKPMASVKGPSTSTTTSTTTNASHSGARKPETSKAKRLPSDWSPTAEHVSRARDLGVDLAREAENFRLHAEANDRRAVKWNAAFTMWLNKAKPATVVPGTVGRREEIVDGFKFVNGKPVMGGPNGMTREQYERWMDERAQQARGG